MKKILFILLFVPFALHAQYNDGMDLLRENDCYKHVAKLLTQKNGRVSDTCQPVYNTESKHIYIVNRDYLKDFPDTINGYTIHRFNDNEDLKAIHNEIEDKEATALFIAQWTHSNDFFFYWVFPIKVKKNKIQYDSKVYKFQYNFHAENARFEYKKVDCIDWGK
jgi:hypothetical protein